MIRKTLVAALVAAAFLPSVAHATGGCFPRVKEQRAEVAGETVTYYVYDGMVC